VKTLQALLADRKRSQRGSVLSAVLIIVAFLAILSGALTTELSTHFLLSSALVNRVANEATVNSAMELALDRLQNTALGSACPLPTSVPLNGRNAIVSYTSCFPTVDVRSPQYASIAPSGSFNVDGSQSLVNGQNVYLVGDSSGNLYQYNYAQSTLNWSVNLQTTITGPALAMADSTLPLDAQDTSTLVPVANGGNPGCPATACVAFLAQDIGSPPDGFPPSCYMRANGTVTSRPAAGVAVPTVAYFGDSAGILWAYTATEHGNCVLQDNIATPGNAAIVAGPIVLQNGAQDEIYVVTSTNQLLRYTYDPGDSPALSLSDNLSLPYLNPVGMALDHTSLPAHVAITFAGGGAALVNIPSNYDPNLATNTVVGSGIAAAPAWCTCPTGMQIGVTGVNGTFYLFGGNLNLITSTAVGQQVRTSPAPDGVGEWFVGAYDGNLYELQESPSGTSVAPVAQFGSAAIGQVKSSPQVGPCSAGLCVYLGSVNNAYMVALDARHALMTACLSTALGVCTGANPRLSAQVEVGVAGDKQLVHVQGWSYTSP
jgi:hypothetical protein